MKRFTSPVCVLAITLVLWIYSSPARAWERPRYEDADVVARSELIVVGAIKPGSVQYVPHQADASGGKSWEHHAMLLIHQVLKGKCDVKEIPIIIHYGLEPLVGGHSKHDGFEMNSPLPTTGPVTAVKIWDEGSLGGGFGSLVQDALRDNLWFLRRGGGIYGWEPSRGDLGIIDPEDLQPLKFKDYFTCYLEKDPESAVRTWLQKQPEIAARATRYLEHLTIIRILSEPNPSVRVERLLPYFLSKTDWDDRGEAYDGIVSAGDVAGPYLMGIYEKTLDVNVRDDIIRMWAKMRYPDCVDLLITLLKEDDQFWAHQDLKAGWWNANVESRLTEMRRDKYGEVYDAVYALGEIGNPRARDAIELTRRRWAVINFENKQIVEACDHALKAFAGQ